jgi:hypothetical protein
MRGFCLRVQWVQSRHKDQSYVVIVPVSDYKLESYHIIMH